MTQPRDTRGRFCRKGEKPTRDKFLDTLLPIWIVILLGAMLCFYVVGYNIGKDAGKADGLTAGIQQGIQQENARDLKADAYTQGHIDGRASVLAENGHGSYNPMGVPTESPQNRTPEWRAYANCIAYDICPTVEQADCGIYVKETDNTKCLIPSANGRHHFEVPCNEVFTDDMKYSKVALSCDTSRNYEGWNYTISFV